MLPLVLVMPSEVLTGHTREMASFISTLQTAKSIFTLRILLGIIFLGMACVSLDHLLQLPAVASSRYYRAVVDNFTHGLVGLLSWAIVIETVLPSNCHQLGEILLCGVLSSILDADHFIVAKSIYLQDALVLPHRPALHSTTLIILISLFLHLTVRVTAAQKLQSLPYMFLTASLSHQIRDGSRRGLWVWPLGSTPPLPYWAYVGLVCILPIVLKLFLNRTASQLTVKPIIGATPL
ncbi:transmembrane protein 267-like [Acanthaster planci]|uniref:Transmembrane protein 267 n=1 Tax=Acanthaster planci TaxID=133434 RepID=A0A8B7ZNX9_ACAPL|nr:transmembrane protein 267-like [Acanthaster planci]